MAVSVEPIESPMTVSAIGSSGVDSRLMITSWPPCSFVMAGKSAAGVTTKDEPTAKSKSACWHHSAACSRTSLGNAWPNEIVACFNRPSGH